MSLNSYFTNKADEEDEDIRQADEEDEDIRLVETCLQQADEEDEDIRRFQTYLPLAEKEIRRYQTYLPLAEKEIRLAEKEIRQAEKDILWYQTYLPLAEKEIRQAEKDILWYQTYLPSHKKFILVAEKEIRQAEEDIRRLETYRLQAEEDILCRERWIERKKEEIQKAEEEIRQAEEEIRLLQSIIQGKRRQIQSTWSVCDFEVKPPDLKTKLIIGDKEIESDDCFCWNEDRYESEVYSQGNGNVAYIGQSSVYDANEDQRSSSWQRRLYNVKKNGPEQRQPFVSFDTNANQRSFAWRRRFNQVKKIYVDRERCIVYTDSIENPRSCAWRRRIYMIMEGPHVDDYNTQLVWIPMISRWKRTKKKHLTDTCVVSEWPDKWKRRPNIHLSLKLSVKAGCIESENVRVITTWGNYLVSVLSFCVYATDVDLQEILGSHWRKCSNHKKRKGKSLGSKMIKIITIEAAPPDKQFR